MTIILGAYDTEHKETRLGTTLYDAFSTAGPEAATSMPSTAFVADGAVQRMAGRWAQHPITLARLRWPLDTTERRRICKIPLHFDIECPLNTTFPNAARTPYGIHCPHMPMTIDDRSQLIRRILCPEEEARSDAQGFAVRSVWLWERIASQLTPLIGEVGFQSLYSRAVHLALPECPGFTLSTQVGPTATLLQSLQGDLVGMDCVLAERCSSVLLQKFIDLVESMIGKMLVEQILQSVWDEKLLQTNRQR